MPFCRRTTTGEGFEWVCGEHWRGVPKRDRRVLARARRRMTQAFQRSITHPLGEPFPPGVQWCGYRGDEAWRLWSPEDFEKWGAARRAFNRLWSRCRKAALEAAAGI